MGEAHATLPLPDATYMFKAGKLEGGTFCAVPVVGDEWTIADPVPLWYICENDWRMFVSCNDAYEGRYDAKDWYGKTRLEECLTRPERLIAKWREENPHPPPPPMPPSPPPTPPSPPAAPSRRVRRRTRGRQAPEARAAAAGTAGGRSSRRRPSRRGGHGRGRAATPPPPPGVPTAGVDDAGAEDGGAGDDNGGSGGGEDVAAPPLPPAPPPAPSLRRRTSRREVFRMYFYEVDFVNHYNEFATLADAAVTQSSSTITACA